MLHMDLNSSNVGDVTLSADVPNTTCRAFMYPGRFAIYGVYCPIIFCLTIITNILVIVVFMKKKMRSPTTVLLIALAISDTLSGMVISYVYVYFYGFGNDVDPMPYPLCQFHDYSTQLAPMFHTASVWITTCLGIQRYIVIAYPFNGPHRCTIKMSFVSIVVVYMASIAMYAPSFMYTNYEPYIQTLPDGSQRQICLCPDNPDVTERYERVVHMLRSAFGQLIPCSLMIVTTVLLVRKLRIESRRSLSLHASEEHEGDRREFRHIRRTSQMIIVLVVTFLFVELPNGILFAIMSYDGDLIEDTVELWLAVILNVFVYTSFLFNFWIYVCLSGQFRNSLRELFNFQKCYNRILEKSGMNDFMTERYEI